MSNILKTIGSNIRKYREIKAITQEELSAVCKLHRNYIGSVERGTRNLSVNSLQKIATGLNVKIERLFE
jgi:transcriptional regulator with XRE-family HTH domain